MNHIPDRDDLFESTLTDALTSRSRHARPGAGSIADVRMRARRRARRRTVTGAGALAVLGGVGAVAAVARHHDTSSTYRLLSGDEAGVPSDAGTADAATIWRCTGMLSAPASWHTIETGTTVEMQPTTSIIVDEGPTTVETFQIVGVASSTSVVEEFATTTSALDPGSATTAPFPATTTILMEPATATTVTPEAVLTSTSLLSPTVTPQAPGGGDYLMTGCTPETGEAQTSTTG